MNHVEILEPAEKGKFIIRRGAEIKKGAVVIPSGEIVTENMVAVLAAFGYSKVKAGGKPTAAILATGSEIVDVGQTPGRDQIRNSNSPMLRGFIEACGAGAVTLPAAGDDVQSLKKQIAKGVERADLLVITGGVSVGKYDFTKTALAELGAEVFFERVRLKPGKPTVFARLNDKLVFGLPGNPVSVAATFFLFVRPALLQMQGAGADQPERRACGLIGEGKGYKGQGFLPSGRTFDGQKRQAYSGAAEMARIVRLCRVCTGRGVYFCSGGRVVCRRRCR